MLRSIRNCLPKELKQVIKRSLGFMGFMCSRLRLLLPHYRRRYCPICQRHAASFLSTGIGPRPNAQCPNCGSLERHRLVWIFWERKTNLFDQKKKRLLHVAPERQFANRLRGLPRVEYISVDLLSSEAMIRLDLTRIPFRDRTFDVIYCSHVLEHIPDDRMAMRELFRVLKRGGWAVLIVPIGAPQTIEDLSITDPKERLRRYGQEDHVRIYGMDFQDRLLEAGFSVACFRAFDLVSPNAFEYLGIPGHSLMFYCTK